MKINPEIGQAPSPAALPTAAVPPPTGEASLFAAMLVQPQSGAPPEPVVAPPAPEDPRPNDSPKMVELQSNPELAVQDAGAAPTMAATAVPPISLTDDGSPPATSLDAPVVEAQVSALGGVNETADLSDPTSTQTALVVPQPSTPKPAPRPTIGPNGRPLAHRAFGFRELGVWGHRGPSGEITNPRICGVTPGYPETKPAGESDRPRGWNHEATLPGEARPREANGVVAGPGANMADVAEGHGSQLTPDQEPAAPQTRGDRAGRLGPMRASRAHLPDDANAEITTSEAAEPLAPPPKASAPLSVSVFDGAGGLQVVAAMPDINPDAVARLRRIAESLAREFGLGLADFSLNGAVIDAPAATDRNPQWR